ncbi:MAG: hypothetical protein Q9166_004902 [cf. Caloplaca sp. 2 TL-2023]
MQEHPKVWTLSPTFRAERSDTSRHVSEFWMLEVELRTQSLGEIMDLVEDMIKSLVQGLKKGPFMEELATAKRSWEKSQAEESLDDGEFISSRWAQLEEGPWPRIPYIHAMQLLQDSIRSGESKFVHEPRWGSGLQLEHERYIVAKVGLGKPVFVTDYPQMIKPFYMLPSATENNNDAAMARTAACFDLLLPEVCEIVGGSLREHRYQELKASMQSHDPNLTHKVSSKGTDLDDFSGRTNSGDSFDCSGNNENLLAYNTVALMIVEGLRPRSEFMILGRPQRLVDFFQYVVVVFSILVVDERASR